MRFLAIVLATVAGLGGVALGAPADSGADLGWVAIPAGTFEMGCAPRDELCSDEELPRHRVTMSRSFQLMTAEVTRGQFRAFTLATGAEMPRPARFSQADDHPVVNVEWEDAVAFCTWAGGRLPTEAAWEYAARGGHNERIYPWGNEPSHRLANYGAEECCAGLVLGPDRWENTAPVRSFPANGYGLFDMAGNVWEWVADGFGPYEAGAVTDPSVSPEGTVHLARGGSWLNFPAALRASNRLPLSGAVSNVGFRCAR